MPQPSIVYNKMTFGNAALPNGQGTMSPVNLNDAVRWFFRSIDGFDRERQLDLGQFVYRSLGAWLAEDDIARIIKLPYTFAEQSQGDLGDKLAKLSQAGEQQLSFDGTTYGLAKFSKIANRKNKTPGSVLNIYWYDFELEFTVRTPYFSDTLQSGSLNGNTFQTDFEATTTSPASTATLWHSLGTEAGTANSIAYWTILAGSPTYSAHVVTMPANGQMSGGHTDWTDCTFTCRFTFATSSAPAVFIRAPTGGWGNALLLWASSSTALSMEVGQGDLGSATTTIPALVNGTSYWFQLSLSGVTATGKLFADSAGAMGAQIGSTLTFNAAVGHTTALAASGHVGIAEVGGTAGCSFGGAFANVCTVTGPIPTTGAGAAWAVNNTGGEPAFAWSKTNPYSGAYSLSIYLANSAGSGYWSAPSTVFPIGTHTLSIAMKASATMGITRATASGDSSPNANLSTFDGAWHLQSATAASTLNEGIVLFCSSGTGTAYWDNLVVSPAGPPANWYAEPAADQLPVAGSTGGTANSFTIGYPGSVWTEPKWQLNIPNTNTVAITQLILKNTMSGETLTINFPGSGLAANTAWTITIDAAACTVTDQNGAQYDTTGGFPKLYGPAGQSNPITATLTCASGTTTGVTLDSLWSNRWEI